MNRERFPHLFADVPPGALFEHGGELFTRYGRTLRAHTVAVHRKRCAFKPRDVVRMSPGEARNAPRARVLTVAGESAPYREVWTRQRACCFWNASTSARTTRAAHGMRNASLPDAARTGKPATSGRMDTGPASACACSHSMPCRVTSSAYRGNRRAGLSGRRSTCEPAREIAAHD